MPVPAGRRQRHRFHGLAWCRLLTKVAAAVGGVRRTARDRRLGARTAECGRECTEPTIMSAAGVAGSGQQ
jgi:hypothetical protein